MAADPNLNETQLNCSRADDAKEELLALSNKINVLYGLFREMESLSSAPSTSHHRPLDTLLSKMSAADMAVAEHIRWVTSHRSKISLAQMELRERRACSCVVDDAYVIHHLSATSSTCPYLCREQSSVIRERRQKYLNMPGRH
jgi:septation ring formation regulator EzrA